MKFLIVFFALTASMAAISQVNSLTNSDYFLFEIKEGGKLSLEDATSQAIDKINSPGGPRHIKIILDDGVYAVAKTLKISGLVDSNRDYSISYVAKNPGGAVIQSGIYKTGTYNGKVVSFKIPNNPLSPGQFFVNGRLATLARTPNEGEYFYGSGAYPSKTKFGISDNFGGGKNYSRAFVKIYQAWSVGYHKINSINSDSLDISPPTAFEFGKWGERQRYFYENLVEALDYPGEWVGAGDYIYYIPRNEAETHAVGIYPSESTLVRIGDSGSVKNITFDGVSFSYSAFPIPKNGYFDKQAGFETSAAVEVNNSSAIKFLNCQFVNLGGSGVWFNKGVSNSVVKGSLFKNLGAAAIKIGSTDGAKDKGGNVVEDNIISKTGLVVDGSAAIWVGNSFDNIIKRNYIEKTSYTGISIGWRWGFSEPYSGGNWVESNLLTDIGMGQLSDLGGVYSLGSTSGSSIIGNVILNVTGYPYYTPGKDRGVWGIYNDWGSTNLTVSGNIVAGADSGAYHIFQGGEIKIKNNIFYTDGNRGIMISKGRDDGAPQASVDNNVFYVKQNAKIVENKQSSTGDGNSVVVVDPGQKMKFDICRSGGVLLMRPASKFKSNLQGFVDEIRQKKISMTNIYSQEFFKSCEN